MSSTWVDPKNWLLFAVGYLVVVLANGLINHFEFKRCPEKRERYRVLPLIYKFGCWLVVLPLFAAGIVQPPLAFLGLVAFVLVEAACVRWYRKAGLW